jgi:hypothetical protein
MQTELSESWDFWWCKSHDARQYRTSADDSQRTSGHCDNDAFDQELAGDITATRSQRSANGELVCAGGDADQEQGADVHTGDREEECNRCRERDQHRPHVADHGCRERLRLCAGEFELGLDSTRDPEEVLPCRINGHSGLESRDGACVLNFMSVRSPSVSPVGSPWRADCPYGLKGCVERGCHGLRRARKSFAKTAALRRRHRDAQVSRFD